MTSINEEDYYYDLELDEKSITCKQPNLISIQLKPHQLACLKKASIMEGFGNIKYYTLLELFDYVKKTVDGIKNPYKVYIRYNLNLGFIEEFYIDKNQHIADEEIGFIVNNFNE